jgi:hypothetical protein
MPDIDCDECAFQFHVFQLILVCAFAVCTSFGSCSLRIHSHHPNVRYHEPFWRVHAFERLFYRTGEYVVLHRNAGLFVALGESSSVTVRLPGPCVEQELITVLV